MGRIAYSINRALGLVGLKVKRVRRGSSGSLSFEDVFHRLQRRNIPIATIIDIGASDGRWTASVSKYFPDRRCHLIEANRIHLDGLEAFVGEHPGASFKIAAAGDQVGEVYFDDSNPWGGVAAHTASNTASKKVTSTTIDEEIREQNLTGPFLIKLDTHGFEVPILQGAKNALGETNILVIETYNFHLNDNCLAFWEMCHWLRQRGFRASDLLEPLHRPMDGMFWQVDIVFMRGDRPEFEHAVYA